MTSVRQFFADKTVLITGATGMLGKALLEKILRDLPDVHRLYLLLRPKAVHEGCIQSVEERLESDLFDSPIFQNLETSRANHLQALVDEKVFPIEGDLQLEALGLAPSIYRQLQDEVDVIINCAASVRYDAPLDQALQINTLGPLRLLELAKTCHRRVVFAHISTCYVNATRPGPIAEEPLDPQVAPKSSRRIFRRPYDVDQELSELRKLIRRTEDRRAADPKSSAAIERRLVAVGMKCARRRGWTDTYTFTKAMAEQLIVRNCGGLPVVIFRPSIIESAWRMPLPGWIEGLRMLDPIILNYGRRHLTCFPARRSCVLDVVPLDMAVSALVTAIACRSVGGRTPTVYQFASGDQNPIAIGEFADILYHYFQQRQIPGSRSDTLLPLRFQRPGLLLARLRLFHELPLLLLQALARTVVFPRTVRRKLRRLCRSRRARLRCLERYARLLGPYGTSRCHFLTGRTRELLGSLGSEERQIFDFDLRQLDWPRYIQETHIPGLMKYVLDADPKICQREAVASAG